MLILLLAAAIAAPPPQGTASPTNETPPLAAITRNPDGSFTIGQAIESDPALPSELTDGLIETEETARAAPDPLGRPRSPAEVAVDEALDQAFEEAIDMARFGRPD